MCCASCFADRDDRFDRPTRQRAVQYINNTGGVVVIGHVVRDREKHAGATSSNGHIAVIMLKFSKIFLSLSYSYHETLNLFLWNS